MAATSTMSADERRLRDALRRAADLLAATTTARLALRRLATLLEPDVVPAAARDAVVARLEAAGAPEPIAAREVQRRLSAAWGEPARRVLDDLDPEPVAVTPGAQVHRAVAGGAHVAVKLARPGLAEGLRADLVLLDAVAPLFAAVLPGLDRGALAREVRERLLDEADLEHEASVQRAVHRALRRHPDLLVPAPRTDLARAGVLVSAWIDGTPVRELGRSGSEAQRVRAARLSVRFFLGTAASPGIVHADPDPDDVLLLADGRLAVLDFGATARVPRGRAALIADVLEAGAARDARATAAALGALDWLPAEAAPAALALADAVAGPLLDPSARLDAAALRGAAQRALRRLGGGLALARRATGPAADAWPLRGAGSLALLLARLEVEADWVALAAEALREGP